jgi:fido (protein-threonine AMPylation protein)
MPIPWNEDPPTYAGVIESNLRELLERLEGEASDRSTPTVAAAQQWHRDVYAGVPLPVDYYAGEVRDSDEQFPELIGYEVRVGQYPGVPSADVPAALKAFEGQLQEVVSAVDSAISGDDGPQSLEQLLTVVDLCAGAHGRWVQIHPFANGNGRVARIWANWCAMRYGLPPFVRLRPRPEGFAYALAAFASMTGDYSPMIGVFASMLDRHLEEGSEAVG